MADNPYSVGDRVLVSRAQNGEDHEEAVVRDAHVLLIGEETRPIVIVEAADENSAMGGQQVGAGPAQQLRPHASTLSDLLCDVIRSALRY